jgi:hypothetical protein
MKGMGNWRRKLQDREQWRTVLEKAMVHKGMQFQKEKEEKMKENNK